MSDPHETNEQSTHTSAVERICSTCNYNLSGLDPHGNCPECGTSIIQACFQCEYELVGLDPSGPCPECGFLIEGSIGRGQLSSADPIYLAKLHKGVFWVQTAIILMVLQFITMFFLGMIAGTSGAGVGAANTINLISPILSIAFSVMLLIGWWMLSTPNPDTSDRYSGDDARKLVRIMILVSAALAVIQLPFTFLSQNGQLNAALLIASGLGLLSFIVFAVRFFAEMFYIKWMAPLLRNKKVYNRARMMMWLGPVLCTVGLLLLGLGPLIALIMYWNMLDWVRKDIKAIREASGSIA